MPAVEERVYRVQAPYAGNAVHLYLVRGEKLALIDNSPTDVSFAMRLIGREDLLPEYEVALRPNPLHGPHVRLERRAERPGPPRPGDGHRDRGDEGAVLRRFANGSAAGRLRA